MEGRQRAAISPALCCCLIMITYLAGMGGKPIIQGLLQEQVRPAALGSIQSACASVALLVSGPLGRASDLHGRGRPLFMMLGVLAVAYGSLALCGPSPVTLTLSLVGWQSMGRAGELLTTAMSDATPAEHSLTSMQVLFACTGLGFGLGPMGGKWGNATLGFGPTISALACLPLAAMVILWAGLGKHSAHRVADPAKSTAPVGAVLLRVLRNPEMRAYFLMRLCQSSAAHIMFSTLGLVIVAELREPKEKLADLLSFNSVIFVAVQVLQPVVARAVGMSGRLAMTFGMGIIVLGRILMLCYMSSFGLLLAYYALVIVGIGLYLPAVTAAVTACADESEVGLIFGVFGTMETAAEIAMPLVGGVVFEVIGPRGPMCVAVVCSCLGTLPLLLLRDASKKNT